MKKKEWGGEGGGGVMLKRNLLSKIIHIPTYIYTKKYKYSLIRTWTKAPKLKSPSPSLISVSFSIVYFVLLVCGCEMSRTFFLRMHVLKFCIEMISPCAAWKSNGRLLKLYVWDTSISFFIPSVLFCVF